MSKRNEEIARLVQQGMVVTDNEELKAQFLAKNVDPPPPAQVVSSRQYMAEIIRLATRIVIDSPLDDDRKKLLLEDFKLNYHLPSLIVAIYKHREWAIDSHLYSFAERRKVEREQKEKELKAEQEARK
jgi:hypothetical protein